MAEIEKLPLTSLDIKEQQIAHLKEFFPEVFTEGNKIDWDKLRLTLGENIEVAKERYGMNWPGKADCFKTIQQPSIATLVPDRDESVDFDKTENLFIEGDNLEVLKLLQKSYLGKVKMIYIDPPYNTGNDFIYPDNYAENLSTYLEYTGQIDAEGRKFATNTETDGRFHSKWMNMMYPRLFLAKNLLREDGVIFISIDDAEINNLKAICNEIFGEENFIGQIIVQSNKRGQTYKEIAKTHEYLLLYSKSDSFEIYELEKDEDSLPYEDSLGKYDLWELRNRNPKFGRFNRPNLYYPIYVAPSSVNEEKLAKVSLQKTSEYCVEVLPKNSEGIDGCWRWEPKNVKENLNDDYSVVVGKQRRDGEWNIYQKSRKSTTKAKSIWADTEVISEQGTVEIGKLGLKNMFDHPKPVELIKRIIRIGSKAGDTILDFFAGSCTLAQAAMELSMSEDEQRQYICVQLPEPNSPESEQYKSGFRTIADISKERIRRVHNKLESEISEKEKKELFSNGGFKSDIGFKVFKLRPSNFKTWDAAIEKQADAIQQALFDHIENVSVDAKQDAILYELLLKSGFELTTKIEKLELAGEIVYSIADGELLICLAKLLTNDVIKAIGERKPSRVICLDEGFSGKEADALKTNAVQIMKSKGVLNFRTV